MARRAGRGGWQGGGGQRGGNNQRRGRQNQTGDTQPNNAGRGRSNRNEDNVYVPPNSRPGSRLGQANADSNRGGRNTTPNNRQSDNRARDGQTAGNPFGLQNRGAAAPPPAATGTQTRGTDASVRGNGRPRGSGVRNLRAQLATDRQANAPSIPQRSAPLPIDKSNLVHHGKRYGDIPKSDFGARFEFLKLHRVDEIKQAVAEKRMNDPDPEVKIDLKDAIRMVGECKEMCPEIERVRRVHENDLKLPEMDPSTLNGPRKNRRVDESRMVKAFRRPAAGLDSQIPSDLRTPQALSNTLDYLFNLVVDEKAFAVSAQFVWDRTRAVRNDFSIQGVRNPHDVSIMMQCYTRIARFHILSMHTMVNPNLKVPDYSHQQDIEQFQNTLKSLDEMYADNKNRVISPDEPEIQSYRLVMDLLMDSPYSEDRIQGYPARILQNPMFRAAMEIYKAGQVAKRLQGPLKPELRRPISRHDIKGFFDVVRSPETPYLLACVAELMFNRIRHSALYSLVHSYRMGGNAPIEGWLVEHVQEYLCFETAAETEAFCARYGLQFEDETKGDSRYLDFNHIKRGHMPYIEEDEPRYFSASAVESKRNGRSFVSIISTSHSGVQQNGTSNTAEDSTSMFIPDTSTGTQAWKSAHGTPLTGSPLNPVANSFQPTGFASPQPKSPAPTALGGFRQTASPFRSAGFSSPQVKAKSPAPTPDFGHLSGFRQPSSFNQPSKPVETQSAEQFKPKSFTESIAAANANPSPFQFSSTPSSALPAEPIFSKAQFAQGNKANPFAGIAAKSPSGTPASTEAAKPSPFPSTSRSQNPTPSASVPASAAPSTTSTAPVNAFGFPVPAKPSPFTPSFASASGQPVWPGVFDATKDPIKFAQPNTNSPSTPVPNVPASPTAAITTTAASFPSTATRPAANLNVPADTPQPANSAPAPAPPRLLTEHEVYAGFANGTTEPRQKPSEVFAPAWKAPTYPSGPIKSTRAGAVFTIPPPPPRPGTPPNPFGSLKQQYEETQKRGRIQKRKDKAMGVLAQNLFSQKNSESVNYWMVVTQVKAAFLQAKETVDDENALKAALKHRRDSLARKYGRVWRDKRWSLYLRRTAKERRQKWRNGQLGQSRYEADIMKEIKDHEARLSDAGHEIMAASQNAASESNTPAVRAETPVANTIEDVRQTATPSTKRPPPSQSDLSGIRLPGTGLRSTETTNARSSKAKDVFKKPLTPASVSRRQSRESQTASTISFASPPSDAPLRQSAMGTMYNDPTEFIDRTESEVFRMRAQGRSPSVSRPKRAASFSSSDADTDTRSAHGRQTSVANKRQRTSPGAVSRTPERKDGVFIKPKDDEERLARVAAILGRSTITPGRTASPDGAVLSRSLPAPASTSVVPRDSNVPAYRLRASRFVPREAYGLGPEAVRAARAARGWGGGSVGDGRGSGAPESVVSGGEEDGEGEEVEESWDEEEEDEEMESEEEDEQQYAQVVGPGASVDDAIELSD